MNYTNIGSPKIRRWVCLAALMIWGSTSLCGAPAWHNELSKISELFDAKLALAGMAGTLEYFRLVFTAVGYGAVMISTVRKVARARGGEESMGWVASLVMTVGMMAAAPVVGTHLFEACDEVAEKSRYSQKNSIETCWNALLVILPTASPVQEVLSDVSSNGELSKGAPQQKEDGAWTKLAWTWMKMAWSTMTNVLDKIGGAFRAISNGIVVMVLLFIPTVAIIVGMVAIQVGGFIRELLHQGMDVFLPMMIAMVSFEPMRGPASNFLTKYVSVALWPVAWALGNGLACSILLSVMTWVVDTCRTTLSALDSTIVGGAPALDPVAAGYLAGAAGALPWGFLQVIVLVITLTSLLIIVSAVGAPLALTATISKGACFAAAQLQGAAAMANTNGSSSMPGGAALSQALGSSGMSNPGSGGLSSLALRASSSMGGAASRLAPMAAMGGAGGMMASMGASALTRASNAVGAWANNPSSDSQKDAGGSNPVMSTTSMVSVNTMTSSGSGSGSAGSTASTRTKRVGAVARSYRRNA